MFFLLEFNNVTKYFVVAIFIKLQMEICYFYYDLFSATSQINPILDSILDRYFFFFFILETALKVYLLP